MRTGCLRLAGNDHRDEEGSFRVRPHPSGNRGTPGYTREIGQRGKQLVGVLACYDSRQVPAFASQGLPGYECAGDKSKYLSSTGVSLLYHNSVLSRMGSGRFFVVVMRRCITRPTDRCSAQVGQLYLYIVLAQECPPGGEI